MVRVKGSSSRKKKKKLFKATKGFIGSKRNVYKTAKEALRRALRYSYRDRRAKKRDFRKLWIIRINAAVREAGLTYNKFIHGLKLLEIDMDRQILSELAINDKEAFDSLIELVREKLNDTSSKN